MALITLRAVKGSPLTNNEVDDNFNNINNEIVGKLDASEYTAADVLNKIKTVDGVGSGLDADLLNGLTSSTSNTVNTVVARNANGDFAARIITATTFIGNLTGNVNGTLTGNVVGDVSGTAGFATNATNADTATNANNLSGVSANGILVRTSAGNHTARTVVAANANLTVTNGNGVSGNITVDIGANVATLTGAQTFSGAKTFSETIQATNTTINSPVIRLTGNGATNQNKNIKVTDGILEVTNSNDSAVILSLTNAGDLTATGNVTAYSDARVKKNIQTIENALDKVKHLRGVSFDRTDIESHQIGVIAQEIKAILPEVVIESASGDSSVAYGNIVAVLIEAIKELNNKVDNLNKGS